MTTVLIVAAYPSVRAGLRAMLDGLDGIEVTGEAGPAGFHAGDAGSHPEVVVGDLGEDPETLLGVLGGAAPGTPAVFLADSPEDFRGLANDGPRAYLLREATAEEIAGAVLAVDRGLVVYAATVAAELTESHTLPRPGDAGAGDPLTEREREVLELLAAGLPNKTIARDLGISEHTAKFHVSAILGKLGAAGRTEAVMIAARRGLLAL